MPYQTVDIRRVIKFLLVFAVTSMFIIPSFAYSAAQVVVTPRMTVEEHYDSNIDLDPSEEKDDYVTVYSPGIAASYFDERKGLDLDYELGFTRYNEYDENDTTVHNGTVHSWYSIYRNLEISLDDTFVKGNDPRDVREETVLTPVGEAQVFDIRESQGRNDYWRNTFNPNITWEFGNGRSVDLGYTNSRFENDREDLTDSQENTYSASLSYRFNVRHTVEISYDFIDTTFDLPDPTEPSQDFIGHDLSIGYIRTFTRHTHVELRGDYVRRIYDHESTTPNYHTEDASLTLYHSFSPTLSGYGRYGYFWRHVQRQPVTSDPEWELGMTKTGHNWTLNGSYTGGYREQYIDRENLGYEKYWTITSTFTHNYHDKWLNTADVSYDHEEIGGEENNTRSTTDFAFTSRYNINRWLAAEVEYDYLKRTADESADEYKDHRVFLRLIAYYDIFRSAPSTAR